MHVARPPYMGVISTGRYWFSLFTALIYIVELLEVFWYPYMRSWKMSSIIYCDYQSSMLVWRFCTTYRLLFFTTYRLLFCTTYRLFFCTTYQFLKIYFRRGGTRVLNNNKTFLCWKYKSFRFRGGWWSPHFFPLGGGVVIDRPSPLRFALG